MPKNYATQNAESSGLTDSIEDFCMTRCCDNPCIETIYERNFIPYTDYACNIQANVFLIDYKRGK